MRLQNPKELGHSGDTGLMFSRLFTSVAGISVLLLVAPSALAAITWDAGGGTQWWFDPVNWNTNSNSNLLLPPTTNSAATPQDPPLYTPTDAQVNIGVTGAWNVTGEGVLYDPASDPNFDDADTFPYPDGFGPQVIQQLYLARQTTTDLNLVTIKGDLQLIGNMQLGRSSNTPGLVAVGRVNQESGIVRINNDALDVAATDTSENVTGENYGAGIYDYRGGVLEVSLEAGSGLRLSPSSSTVGAAGVGRFVMHNPSTPGYVRTMDYNAAAGAGIFLRLANGETTGVGISEFHFENGGTRPIQVPRNLILNNGLTESGTGAGGIRSPRLDLVLNEAPDVDEGGVPQNLGLFDVDFFDPDLLVDPVGNSTSGAGANGDFFSSADGSTVLTQGAMVSATYAGSTYNWTISYTGEITWANADAGSVGSISGTGGIDVVLIGHSSVIVPGGVDGDYNDDGVVDAADYVIWRKNEGTSNALPNDPDGGIIGMNQYSTWRDNFGETAAGTGTISAAGIVPEPGTMFLVWSGLAAAGLVRRRL